MNKRSLENLRTGSDLSCHGLLNGLRVYAALSNKPQSVEEIQAKVGLSRCSVRRHLATLESECLAFGSNNVALPVNKFLWKKTKWKDSREFSDMRTKTYGYGKAISSFFAEIEKGVLRSEVAGKFGFGRRASFEVLKLAHELKIIYIHDYRRKYGVLCGPATEFYKLGSLPDAIKPLPMTRKEYSRNDRARKKERLARLGKDAKICGFSVFSLASGCAAV